jgi:hypothetical protein
MAITATDIEFRKSTNDGTPGPGDSEAGQGNDDSIGGFMSTTEITTATLHNLFDVITGDENAAESVDYRGFFVLNDHASLTWQGAVAWISAEEAGGADAAIALAQQGVVDRDSASVQMDRLADEETAPSGESFSAPTTKGTGLSIGDIPPDDVQGIFVRRTATDSAALDSDGVTISVEGDTAE